jgi:hypothetical protein
MKEFQGRTLLIYASLILLPPLAGIAAAMLGGEPRSLLWPLVGCGVAVAAVVAYTMRLARRAISSAPRGPAGRP